MAKRCSFQIDVVKSTQVLALDVPKERDFQGGEAKLLARPPLFARRMMPASLVAQKAKMFDDGLMAAVDLAADRGCGHLPGKSAFLKRWQTDARSETLRAALELRAGLSEIPKLDTPISFYTWSPELQRIFCSDRCLQRPVEPTEAERLWSALDSCGVREDYAALLQLSARLTNPLASRALGGGYEQAIFPASESTEQRLMEAFVENSDELPADFDLVEELRSRLLMGELTLKPGADSGFYQYCQWCLEALVHDRDLLERKKLLRRSGYQECLNDLFRALFGLTRETHIKQLKGMTLCLPYGEERPKVTVKPSLRVEPLLTYYIRRAQSYEFALATLEESFGVEALEGLHRLTPDGIAEPNLAHELAWMIRFFYGLAQISAEDLGLDIQVGPTETALDWLKHRQSDADLSQDIRCMVPIFYDRFLARFKVLAVVGYSCRKLEISFAKEPKVTVKDLGGNVLDADLTFDSHFEDLIYPVAIQFYTDTLLNREQFRALCNSHSSLSALREAFQTG